MTHCVNVCACFFIELIGIAEVPLAQAAAAHHTEPQSRSLAVAGLLNTDGSRTIENETGRTDGGRGRFSSEGP